MQVFSVKTSLKAAKTQCLVKIQMIIDAIMKARSQYYINLSLLDDHDFVGVPKGFNTKVELTLQEQEMLEISLNMSKNIYEPNSTLSG